ncbi:MAG: DUF5924 family protein [Cellvibrio sp.]|uniref:DUF5924 family protein n=1 Tax=Cellvibrio sp. TaxID=1965322 RepID=UPI00271ECFE5|nr:DUF5924 family protein [Cellvibrio sp.]
MMLSVRAKITTLVEWIFVFAQRYPFAIALFGFVSGVLSFVMVDRNQEFAQLIAIMMLVSWLWLASEVLLKQGIFHWFGFKLPPALISFATQMVHQESLFFVIPFFFITTAWNSAQMAFTGLLMVAALVSIIDPIYYRWLAQRRWLYFAFHGVTLFAVLLTALPIIFQIPTPQSYLWALLISIILTLPNVARSMQMAWWKRIVAVILLATAAGLFGLVMRPFVPPATLWLTEVAITDEMNTEERVPVRVFKTVSAEQLRQGIYAYTAIHAPRGLNETIYHVWTHNGKVIDKVALHISGARKEGYRSWSRKENFPENSVGRWNIRVVTEANQLIGILRFRVITAPGIEQPSKEPTTEPMAAPEAETSTENSTKTGTESSAEAIMETSTETNSETSTEPDTETSTEETGAEPDTAPASEPSE